MSLGGKKIEHAGAKRGQGVMKITGYGKGWQEEKATTLIARFRQTMREPATTTAYIVAFGLWALMIPLLTAVVIFLAV